MRCSGPRLKVKRDKLLFGPARCRPGEGWSALDKTIRGARGTGRRGGAIIHSHLFFHVAAAATPQRRITNIRQSRSVPISLISPALPSGTSGSFPQNVPSEASVGALRQLHSVNAEPTRPPRGGGGLRRNVQFVASPQRAEHPPPTSGPSGSDNDGRATSTLNQSFADDR